jgi:hypothetical protein
VGWPVSPAGSARPSDNPKVCVGGGR